MGMFAIALLLLSAQAGAASQEGSVQIGRSPEIDVSTPSHKNVLDTRISLTFRQGTLRAFLEELHRTANLDFYILDGLDKCPMSAYLHDLTSRETLQLLIEAAGITFQQLGRSNEYTITTWKSRPQCPAVSAEAAAGACAAGSPNISIECKGGQLSQFAELLSDQSGASIIVWNEATEHPTSVKVRTSNLQEAIRRLRKDKNLSIREVGTSSRYAFTMAHPKRLEGHLRTEGVVIGRDDLHAPKRKEPPANPTFDGGGVK
jgi:hypothetical protein